MQLSSELKRVVAQALTCSTLSREEVRFLHQLHLQLLAGLAQPSDTDCENVLKILADYAIPFPSAESISDVQKPGS
jgi:hypothetical protein